jgi:hypothetical protein
MITTAQREVLTGLERLLELSSPDIRIGQLVAWLGFLAEDMEMRGLGDIDDDQLLVFIDRFRKDLGREPPRPPRARDLCPPREQVHPRLAFAVLGHVERPLLDREARPR